ACAGPRGAQVWYPLAGSPPRQKLQLEVPGRMEPPSISWTPDGRQLALGGLDTTIQVLDAESGGRAVLLRGHRRSVSATAWGRDEKLWSASLDGTVGVWDVDQQRLLHTWLGHTDEVGSLAISPTGKYVASGSQDG